MAGNGDALNAEQVRRVQLQVLRAFIDHCEQQGLTYMLAYGTLLGAVRHRGYIPWDDDIDVMMPRADYERLRVESAGEGLCVGGSTEDPSWPYTNVKIGDRTTVVRGDGLIDSGIGVNIDVFPIDYLPTGALRAVQRLSIRLVAAILALQSMMSDRRRSLAKRLLLVISRPLTSLIPRPKLLRLLDRLATTASLATEARGVVVGPNQWSVPPEALDAGSSIEFEHLLVRAPLDVTATLTAIYGPTFMTPPPVEQRVSHHTFTAHWR